MPFAPYRWIDDALLHTAEGAVRAYNRTIGGTKDELANYCVLAGDALIAGGVTVGQPFLAPMSLALLVMSIRERRSNTDAAEDERMTRAHGLTSVQAEQRKKDGAIYGPVVGMLGGVTYGTGVGLPLTPVQRIGTNVAAAGCLVKAASYYVMRADDRSRQPNVWKRQKARRQARQGRTETH